MWKKSARRKSGRLQTRLGLSPFLERDLVRRYTGQARRSRAWGVNTAGVPILVTNWVAWVNGTTELRDAKTCGGKKTCRRATPSTDLKGLTPKRWANISEKDLKTRKV